VGDSIIDLIRAGAGMETLTLHVPGGMEWVKLDSATDLGMLGLVLTPDTSPRNLTLEASRTLEGSRTIDLTGAPSGSPLITVGAGVTLTLKNVILKGLKAGNFLDDDNNTAPLVRVANGGTLIMENVEIRDNYNEDPAVGGGGVSVSGSFTMKGGTIADNTACHSGGVYVIGETGGVTVFSLENGLVYGNDGSSDQNTATSSIPKAGHALYIVEDPSAADDPIVEDFTQSSYNYPESGL
jgi:hypothetical protein